jgi:hypothetical protein
MWQAYHVGRDENDELVVAPLNLFVGGGLQAGDFTKTG